MEVIYLDNHLLAVNKKAGIATQAHDASNESLEEVAKKWIKEKYRKPGKVFLEPIHRIDRPVSGLVLFARTSKALSRLQEAMREKQIHKTYYALVDGKLPSEEGTLEHYLVHDEFRARVVSSTEKDAKLARLHFKVLDTPSLVEIVLETGRYHQIRAQFAAIGCPIVGDRKYGSKTAWKKDEIALHHVRLEFPHPVNKENLILKSPIQFRPQRIFLNA